MVAMAATGNEVIYQGAFGKRDLLKDDPMTADSVFWIASMTKAITCAAGMQLVEQGKLSLDERRQLLPDLASPQVLEGFDAGQAETAPGEEADHAASSHDPHRRLLLRRVERRHGEIPGEDRNPEHLLLPEAALKGPIMSDPGTRWEYGINIDFVGKAVEAASGKRLDAYLRDHMFAPLGMNDIGFKITGFPTPAAGRHTCARRGRIAGADPV